MTVLHLISDTARRGAQVFAVQLNAELGRLGLPGEVAALAQASTGNTLDVLVLGSGFSARRKILASHEFVIAHGSTTLEAAALLVPRRFAYRSIGDPSFWLNTPARRLKTGALLHVAKAVIALYPAAAASLRRRAWLPANRIHIVPNAVSLPLTVLTSVEQLPAEDKLVLYVGALSWEKQVDQLIDAVAQLRGVGLVLVGDGPQRTDLEAKAASKLGSRALFVGAVDDPTPYYHRCDVLGLSSRTEGMPACVLEASLAGLPTCAYQVGGISEMVLHGETGRVVPQGDVIALAQGLRWSIDNRKTLGPRAEAHTKLRYSMGAVAAQWRQIIQGLTGRAGY